MLYILLLDYQVERIHSIMSDLFALLYINYCILNETYRTKWIY